jgi:hypothetical protein
MKYVNTFESFKTKRLQPVNEEFLGALLNFFKKMWNDAVEDIKKLGENPTMDQLDKWIEDNIFNRSSNTYIFKSVIEEFKKKTEANVEDCLTLIDSIIDPETGVMGKQGLNPFYDSLLKAFGKNLAPLETIKYYFTTSRNRAIKDYKYAGGPDLGKVDNTKKNMDVNDKTHLPDFKLVLLPVKDDKKKLKEVTIKWVEGTLIPRLLKYIQEVKPEDVNKYLQSKNIKSGSSGYEVGDTVIYKRDSFDQAKWDALSDDDKKKPSEGKIKDLETEGIIGTMKISKLDGEKVNFEGASFTKLTSDILMKIEATKVEGQEELVTSLKDLKDKNPDAIKKIDDITKIYTEPETNKTKIEEIDKIIEGEQ